MKLYDLFENVNDNPAEARFIMRAPLTTITTFLNLHNYAIIRVERETEHGGLCVLHQGSRELGNKTSHTVQRAVDAIGPDEQRVVW